MLDNNNQTELIKKHALIEMVLNSMEEDINNLADTLGDNLDITPTGSPGALNSVAELLNKHNVLKCRIHEILYNK